MQRRENPFIAYKELMEFAESSPDIRTTEINTRRIMKKYTQSALRYASGLFRYFFKPEHPFENLAIEMMQHDGSLARVAFAAGMLSEA